MISSMHTNVMHAQLSLIVLNVNRCIDRTTCQPTHTRIHRGNMKNAFSRKSYDFISVVCRAKKSTTMVALGCSHSTLAIAWWRSTWTSPESFDEMRRKNSDANNCRCHIRQVEFSWRYSLLIPGTIDVKMRTLIFYLCMKWIISEKNQNDYSTNRNNICIYIYIIRVSWEMGICTLVLGEYVMTMLSYHDNISREYYIFIPNYSTM